MSGGLAEPGEVPFWSGEKERSLPDTEAFNKDAAASVRDLLAIEINNININTI